MPERAICGSVTVDSWQKLADMLGCSKRTAFRKRAKLLAAGAIFYQWLGQPRKKRMCFFESVIKEFIILASSKGECI